MEQSKTHILACETLRDELELVMEQTGCAYPIHWVESGLHAHPEKLHAHIQQRIDELQGACSTLLLVFGFCGNSMVDIRSGALTLVLPRVGDCIPLFVGGQRERDAMGADTYFLTKGYMQGEQNIVKEHGYYLERYGEKRAVRLSKMMLQHYRRFAVVDTGVFDTGEVEAQVRVVADVLDIPVEFVPGNLIMLKRLVEGLWDGGDFLVVPQGGSIRFEDSLGLSSGQAGA